MYKLNQNLYNMEESKSETLLSPEELKQKETKIIEGYKNHMKLLTPQRAYWEAVAAIEESRLRTEIARYRLAEFIAGQQEKPQQEETLDPEDGTMPNIQTSKLEPKRTLKKPETV